VHLYVDILQMFDADLGKLDCSAFAFRKTFAIKLGKRKRLWNFPGLVDRVKCTGYTDVPDEYFPPSSSLPYKTEKS
jgi:hypothetical protein